MAPSNAPPTAQPTPAVSFALHEVRGMIAQLRDSSIASAVAVPDTVPATVPITVPATVPITVPDTVPDTVQ